MNNRRRFIKSLIGFVAVLGAWLNPFVSFVDIVQAKARRFVSVKGQDGTAAGPEDTSVAEKDQWVTPLDRFQTMGATHYDVDIQQWRLHITGRVKNPLTLTYTQLMALPSVERHVVLVCPGFFTNRGRWKGVSMKPLLEKAVLEEGVTQVTVLGHNGALTKREVFPIADILADKVFLAYGVNGFPLPEKHGYPLRVVAEGYQGDDWVKYVYEMDVH